MASLNHFVAFSLLDLLLIRFSFFLFSFLIIFSKFENKILLLVFVSRSDSFSASIFLTAKVVAEYVWCMRSLTYVATLFKMKGKYTEITSFCITKFRIHILCSFSRRPVGFTFSCYMLHVAFQYINKIYIYFYICIFNF